MCLQAEYEVEQTRKGMPGDHTLTFDEQFFVWKQSNYSNPAPFASASYYYHQSWSDLH